MMTVGHPHLTLNMEAGWRCAAILVLRDQVEHALGQKVWIMWDES
jgi:hypothetical protein